MALLLPERCFQEADDYFYKNVSSLRQRVDVSNRRVKRSQSDHLLTTIIKEEQYAIHHKKPFANCSGTEYIPISKCGARKKLGAALIGRNISYGSMVMLENSQGKFLKISQDGRVSVTSSKSKLMILNGDDIYSKGLVHYGNRISFMAHSKLLATRIKAGKSPNAFKVGSVQHFGRTVNFVGRWKCIDPENSMHSFSSPQIGTGLKHLDSMSLENDWNFLLHKDDMLYLKKYSNQNIERSSDRITWKLHLVTGNSKDREDSLTRGQLQITANRDRHLVEDDKPFGKSILLHMEDYRDESEHKLLVQRTHLSKVPKHKLSFSETSLVVSATMSTMKKSKLLSMASKLEVSISTDIWAELQYHEMQRDEKINFTILLRACRVIQRRFRKWRNDRWERSFKFQDINLKEDIQQNVVVSKCNKGACKSKLHFQLGDSRVDIDVENETRTFERIIRNEDPREVVDDWIPVSKTEFHYLVLRQCNPALFSEIPQACHEIIRSETYKLVPMIQGDLRARPKSAATLNTKSPLPPSSTTRRPHSAYFH